MQRNGPAWAGGEDPDYVIRQPVGMARPARTPAVIRHPAGDGRLPRGRRVEHPHGREEQLPAMWTLSASVPACGCAVETTVDTTFSGDCVKSITETSRET